MLLFFQIIMSIYFFQGTGSCWFVLLWSQRRIVWVQMQLKWFFHVSFRLLLVLIVKEMLVAERWHGGLRSPYQQQEHEISASPCLVSLAIQFLGVSSLFHWLLLSACLPLISGGNYEDTNDLSWRKGTKGSSRERYAIWRNLFSCLNAVRR